MSIGQNIKRFRKEKGYTQRELADMLGVSVQAISKWETEMGAPDISQIVPLASALDISTDELFGYSCRNNSKDWENMKEKNHRLDVFREQRDSAQNYEFLYQYCQTHPQNPEAASLCLKCLVDMIGAGLVQEKSKGELIAECEKYANCVSKYETDADTIFMSHFVLARGYLSLGEKEKANEILQKIPVRFGDRMYWEAEIDYANKEYDTALLKCRASFSRMARFVARCIRIARDIYIARENKYDLGGQLEYDEYMYRIVDAFMSGGDYLPCRQVFHKYGMLHDIAEKCIKLGRFDRAVECAEMLFEGREEFVRFLKAPQNCTTLLFEDNDAFEDQREIRELVDSYVEETVENIKKIPDYKNDQRIMTLLEKYELL